MPLFLNGRATQTSKYSSPEVVVDEHSEKTRAKIINIIIDI
jgi:hypothetical protein